MTDLDYESSKTTYTIEITEPNAATAISTVRVTITVLDVNEAPTAPEELMGSGASAQHAADVRSNLYHVQRGREHC